MESWPWARENWASLTVDDSSGRSSRCGPDSCGPKGGPHKVPADEALERGVRRGRTKDTKQEPGLTHIIVLHIQSRSILCVAP